MNCKRSTLTYSIVLIAVVLLIGTQETFAQFSDSMGVQWNNAGSSLASTMIWGSIFNRIPGAAKTKSKAPASTTSKSARHPTSSSVKADPNALRFHGTGAYEKTGDLAATLGNTPAEREQYRKLMNAVLDAFNQKARAAGFANDLPVALAFFLGENLRIYRGLPDLSDQQYVELRNGIAEVLAANGALNNLSDRQKQDMFETLVAYTGITQYGYEQGIQAKNEAIITGYRKVAGQNLLSVTKTSPDQIDH